MKIKSIKKADSSKILIFIIKYKIFDAKCKIFRKMLCKNAVTKCTEYETRILTQKKCFCDRKIQNKY